MRSLVTRRAALATGVATLAAIALAGCSAGQVAETSLKKPSVYGVNAESSDQSVAIRNLAVAYKGTTGYPAGADATLQVGLYNQTRQTVTVLISSKPAAGTDGKDTVVSAQSVGLVGGASATPSAAATASPEPSTDPSAGPSSSVTPSAEPSASAPAARPARIEIAPLGAATFLPEDAQQLQALGLSGKLVPGQSINLVFEFSSGAAPLVLQAPVAIPLVPASRAPGVPHEDTEE
ncbi:hypothetical protein DMB66_22090 [Actinoplanes sp. ATCC 53533]|uniref:hypothetical protein n=1 Tax=Actinoplanes sp. ATCC 53533 TaxID=1288362 RepID=UPI000F772795|nr:hypothetical protein [Actinoplanes sp. ATCC 53533]RSM63791.1 hypothetical protein DMB66_22090 [Actinoplanes sp. ATCC 53533]